MRVRAELLGVIVQRGLYAADHAIQVPRVARVVKDLDRDVVPPPFAAPRRRRRRRRSRCGSARRSRSGSTGGRSPSTFGATLPGATATWPSSVPTTASNAIRSAPAVSCRACDVVEGGDLRPRGEPVRSSLPGVSEARGPADSRSRAATPVCRSKCRSAPRRHRSRGSGIRAVRNAPRSRDAASPLAAAASPRRRSGGRAPRPRAHSVAGRSKRMRSRLDVRAAVATWTESIATALRFTRWKVPRMSTARRCGMDLDMKVTCRSAEAAATPLYCP